MLDRKVLKMERYSSVTLLVSPKNPISAEKLKIMFFKNPNFSPFFFPEWFGPTQIEAIRFQNGFHDNSAQTDCSEEMWIPILKGLKHLNTVLPPTPLCPVLSYFTTHHSLSCPLLYHPLLLLSCPPLFHHIHIPVLY